MSEQPLILDRLGQSIQDGDYLIYAGDRYDFLRIGRVIQARVICGERYGEPYWHVAVTVRGVDDDWHRKPRLCKNNGTLKTPKRCVVIRRDQVPAEHLKLLDTLEE